MATTLKTYLLRYLRELKALTPEELLRRRYEKFRQMGKFLSDQPAPDRNGFAGPIA